jgi:putative ABC transport system ATP-binding protein
MALIIARDLTKTYPSGSEKLIALNGVSFEIGRDEFVAIMGPSGSGKSTLMNLIGLLDQPSSGHLTLAGKDVTTLKPDKQAFTRNRLLGFVFQSYNLLARSTALENVELPLVYAGKEKKERVARARSMLERVGLAERSDHWPNQLSGGEQQRVAIARAMVSNPALILADEPTGALDTSTGEDVLRLFQDFNANGRAIVMVTHEESVARYADRILTLRDGKLESDERVKNPTCARNNNPADKGTKEPETEQEAAET